MTEKRLAYTGSLGIVTDYVFSNNFLDPGATVQSGLVSRDTDQAHNRELSL
tara:strand:- start:981 stop:1133 length:153 start_codon:yes stop_codon:yes gene_type:complete